MSTQGVRHLALFLRTVCRLVVLTAAGSSLETQASTSRGLDAEPPPELSTARMWATSDSPSAVEDKVFFFKGNVLCWWFRWQQTTCMTGYGGSRRAEEEEIKRFSNLTSPRLGIGYIDKTIHHLAHLLDLRSRAVDWAAWVIYSFKGKKFITDALLLHSGSLPLCPAQTNKQSFICILDKKICNSYGHFKVKSPYLLVEYRVRMLNLCWLLNM